MVLGCCCIFLKLLDLLSARGSHIFAGNFINNRPCFFLPAILVFAAVAAEGHQNTNMANSINMMKAVNPNNEHFDMNVYFPWALLLCGKLAFRFV